MMALAEEIITILKDRREQRVDEKKKKKADMVKPLLESTAWKIVRKDALDYEIPPGYRTIKKVLLEEVIPEYVANTIILPMDQIKKIADSGAEV
jgi:hypothetical protein